MQKRNRRAGVEDRWTRADGTRSSRYGVGMRWRARYVDGNNREHSKMFGRKAEATAWLNKQVSDQVTGAWTDPNLSVVTFSVMAERWFATKANKAPKTIVGYRGLLDTLVLPRWGTIALRDITFEDVQAWVTALSVDGSFKVKGKGLSASRVIQAHQVLGQVLRYAVKARHLASNPAEDIDLPAKVETGQRYLTHEQLHRLAVASGRFRTMVFVLGYCGLRFGEAAALRVSNVDLDGRRIHVRRSVTYVTGQGLVEGPTKTKANRTVPLPAFLVPLLKSEIGDRPGSGLLFQSHKPITAISAASARYPKADNWVTVGELRWVFDPAAISVGVEGLVPQELRHTCASLAIKAGANIKVVQRLLGHETAALTLDRYGHLYGDDLDAVAAAFDAAAVPLRSQVGLTLVNGPASGC